jgi:hypothetical protein
VIRLRIRRINGNAHSVSQQQALVSMKIQEVEDVDAGKMALLSCRPEVEE